METKAEENIENESSKSTGSLLTDFGQAAVIVFEKTDGGVRKVSKNIRGKDCICKVCNNGLPLKREGVMESKCECTFALMHQQCAIDQSKNVNAENTANYCDVCHQNIQIADVNLWWSFRGGGALPPGESYGMMEKQEDEFLVVKVKSTQGQVDGEQDKKVHIQEAVCRSCWGSFEQDNVVMTKCECKSFTLIHEDCAKKLSDSKGNNKCDVCGQDGQDIPVILAMPQLSSTLKTGKRSRFCKT